MDGWIKLHRKIRENSIFNNLELLRLWIICLTEATHKQRNQIVGKQSVDLEPGQFITGRFDLQTMYNDGLKRDQQKSPKTVWRWLEGLENAEYLTVKTTNKFSIVQIKNWDLYQSFDQQFDQQVTNKRPTSDQQVTTNKNVKNVKNEKNINNRLYDENDSPFKIAKYLHHKITLNAAESGVGNMSDKTDLQKWADDCRKLIEIDKADKELIRQVIDWATVHPFWKSNILSASKLRAKFKDLAMKMNQEKGVQAFEKHQGFSKGIRPRGYTPPSPSDSRPLSQRAIEQLARERKEGKLVAIPDEQFPI